MSKHPKTEREVMLERGGPMAEAIRREDAEIAATKKNHETFRKALIEAGASVPRDWEPGTAFRLAVYAMDHYSRCYAQWLRDRENSGAEFAEQQLARSFASTERALRNAGVPSTQTRVDLLLALREATERGYEAALAN